jgi:regulator of sigma E protease
MLDSIISILNSIVAFVIALGILVFIHEFGHFVMARINGMRVNVFALGMGFRLFGWNKVNGFTFGTLPEDLDLQDHCDYRLSLLPIGGYCKIAGIVDESFDIEFSNNELQPWEYRAKKPFQQAMVDLGGVMFNTLLAIILFAIVIFNLGEHTFKTTTLGEVNVNSIGEFCGFEAGDSIISINNIAPTNWNELIEAMTIGNLGDNLNVKLNRNGNDTFLYVNGKELISKITSEIPLGLEPSELKVVVNCVFENGLAIENDIKPQDTIIAVNSELVCSRTALISILQANKNQNITLTTKNDAGITEKELMLNNDGTLGIGVSSVYTGEMITIDYNIFQSIRQGTIQTFKSFELIILSIKQIIIGNMSFKSAIGGPVMIAKQAATSAEKGILSFINFTAMLSVSLALINILPFPALDGGHLIIIIIEAIIRREIPIKVKLVVQQIGIGCLMLLMAYVIFNDILKLV